MKHIKFLVLVLLLALPIAGVFAQEGAELPVIDPLLVEGDIVTAGSSTVGPLTQGIIERFEEGGYGGVITLDIIGSGAGFERFCVAGESDISNASVPIGDERTEICRENGREAVEFRVGTDALAVAVSVENDFIDNLTIEDLQLIFSSGNSITWADVNPEWPAEAIMLFSPGTDSGTYEFFVEVIFRPVAVAEGLSGDERNARANELILNASGIQLSEDDNVLVNGVADSPYAIGYFGYAYLQENDDVVRAVPINDVEPTVESLEAIGDEAYPLGRPLFIYSATNIMCEKPQVVDFIAYYLANVNDVVEEVGYFPASETALETARQNWLDAVASCE